MFIFQAKIPWTEIALGQKSVFVCPEHAAGRAAGVARKLQHVFKEFSAAVYEDPSVVITGEVEAAFQKRLKVRNPSSSIQAYLIPRTADIQGQNADTARTSEHCTRSSARPFHCSKTQRKSLEKSAESSRSR
eukprot:12422660-Karenia_brevis.AAC.1